jgi:hypothetical protein
LFAWLGQKGKWTCVQLREKKKRCHKGELALGTKIFWAQWRIEKMEMVLQIYFEI